MSLRIDFVFPRFKMLSGAERSILEFAAGLRREGHAPRVVAHRFDDSCRPLLAEGVELVTTGLRLDWTGNRYLDAGFDYARTGALRDRLDPEADAVILCGPALRLAAGILARPEPRPVVVYHCFEPPRVLYQDRDDVLDRAGWLARQPLRWALHVYRRIDRRLVSRAEAITTVGPYSARRIEEVYGRPAIAVTHGLDRERLDAPPDVELPPADLITVNYLHPRKRVDLALRALAALPPELGRVRLEVVGGGPERGRLEALASEIGLGDRVRFAGFVPEERLAAHYHRAACYVHTARQESFGLSVIEAAYCGLPVVAVAEGGVLDTVIDGETGRLVEATPEAVAAGIADVLGRPDRGEALGGRGRERVRRRYRWELGVRDLLEAIESARSSGRGGGS